MSNLDKDIAMAAALGMSYGRYKSEHPGVIRAEPVKAEEQALQDNEWLPNTNCLHCGKAFRKYNTQHRYCCGDCRDKANKVMAAERYRKKVPIDAMITCPMCGTAFLPANKNQKYCGVKCRRAADYQKSKTKFQEENK